MRCVDIVQEECIASTQVGTAEACGVLVWTDETHSQATTIVIFSALLHVAAMLSAAPPTLLPLTAANVPASAMPTLVPDAEPAITRGRP
jgi:hypothetical protein